MDRFSFSDDTPRFDPWTEDDFGYRPFAKHLADVLIKMPAPGGYVIGLHGVWGTGKTSALNFVAHFLDAHNKEVAAGRSRDKPIEVVLFQPWMVSGQQDLISSFFRVLAEKMKDGVEPVKKAKRRFGKAARLAVDPLVKSTVAVAAAAHPPDAIKASGEMAKRAMEQTIDAWLGEPTLQEAHDDLNRRLRKSGRRFVVMIDDIDRLEASEIRSIMQMVKSVGRLANVTYLLAYPSEFTIPKELIDRAAANPDDHAIQDEVLKVAIETKNEDGYSCIGEYLEELQFRLVGSFKMKSGSAVIPALLAKAPLIESLDYPERTGFSPPMLLQSLLRQLLEELGVEAASKILVEAADASNSASVVASLYVWRGRESGKIPLEGERIKPLISDEAYDAIRARALKLIESEAASGTLKAAPFYFDIVRAWSFLDSVDVAKAWLSEVIASDAHALAKATWGFLAYSVRDDGGRHYAFRGLAEMAPYHDREILLAAAERFADSPDLSPDERARIVAVRDGLRGALAREQAAQAQEAGGPVPEADGARPAAAPMARPRRRAARSEPRPPADGASEAAES